MTASVVVTPGIGTEILTRCPAVIEPKVSDGVARNIAVMPTALTLVRSMARKMRDEVNSTRVYEVICAE
jgi:hypothetical protein